MSYKTTSLFVFLLLGIGIIGYLSFYEGEVASSISQDINTLESKESITAKNIVDSRKLESLENQLSDMSNQLSSLTALVKKNQQRSDESSDQIDDSEEYDGITDQGIGDGGVDPFSAEGIALENEIQNNYINQVDEIYNLEELDPDWAQSMETDVLSKLADIDSFTTNINQGNDKNQDGNEGVAADVVVTSFECRSQLCGTEIISGSMDEMLAYQNYMVDKAKHALPSIVFSTIEPYGNKFKMKAYLARDEYEFPAPRNR